MFTRKTTKKSSKFSKLKQLSMSVLSIFILPKPNALKSIMYKRKKGHLGNQAQIVSRLEHLMNNEKIYRNSQLTISDLATKTGTNRTYLSSTINKFYRLNFPSYINTYRFAEMIEYLKKDPDLPNLELAEKCGFGSTDSMKRTISAKTGHTISEFKRRILTKERNC